MNYFFSCGYTRSFSLLAKCARTSRLIYTYMLHVSNCMMHLIQVAPDFPMHGAIFVLGRFVSLPWDQDCKLLLLPSPRVVLSNVYEYLIMIAICILKCEQKSLQKLPCLGCESDITFTLQYTRLHCTTVHMAWHYIINILCQSRTQGFIFVYVQM